MIPTDKEKVASILCYFRTIDEEIRYNDSEIAEIEEIYYSPLQAVNVDGLPHGKGGFHSTTETVALNVPESASDTIRVLQRQNESLRALKREILKELGTIGFTNKAVLYDFYIKGFQWVRISERLHYSTRQCQNLRDSALERLAKRFEKNKVISEFQFPA